MKKVSTSIAYKAHSATSPKIKWCIHPHLKKRWEPPKRSSPSYSKPIPALLSALTSSNSNSKELYYGLWGGKLFPERPPLFSSPAQAAAWSISRFHKDLSMQVELPMNIYGRKRRMVARGTSSTIITTIKMVCMSFSKLLGTAPSYLYMSFSSIRHQLVGRQPRPKKVNRILDTLHLQATIASRLYKIIISIVFILYMMSTPDETRHLGRVMI